MKNKTYDIVKWTVTVALPALNVLWLTLGQIWGLPFVIQIGATIAAIGVFGGALLGIASIKYASSQEK